MTITISDETRRDARILAERLRLDANETAAFERELESIKAQIVEAEYPSLKARELIPLEGGVDAGAEAFTWRAFDRVGLAKLIANYADDLPNVSEYGTEVSTPIRTIGVAYHYSVLEAERAAKTGRPLEARRARLAREAVERLIDKVCAHGDSSVNLPGFLSNPNVTIVDISGLTGDWDASGTTAAQLLADLMSLAFEVWETSKQVHGASGLRMVVGTQTFKAMSSKVFSEYTGESVLSVFLKTQKMITEVIPWVECDLADAEGNGERMVIYEPSPENLGMIVPEPFRQLPAQAKGLSYTVPALGRVGGTVVFRPLCMVYVDGLLD